MDIKELSFYLNVTRIYRKNIDLLIKISDEHRKKTLETFLDASVIDSNTFTEASFYIADSHRIAFSLYALAIVHCYTLVENNRKKILLKIPNLTGKQKNGLSKIGNIDLIIKSKNLDHEKIKSYDIMNEFRLLNNEVKHDRYNLSTEVTVNKKVYNGIALKNLYLEKVQHLEAYLKDLYNNILANNNIV